MFHTTQNNQFVKELTQDEEYSEKWKVEGYELEDFPMWNHLLVHVNSRLREGNCGALVSELANEITIKSMENGLVVNQTERNETERKVGFLQNIISAARKEIRGIKGNNEAINKIRTYERELNFEASAKVMLEEINKDSQKYSGHQFSKELRDSVEKLKIQLEIFTIENLRKFIIQSAANYAHLHSEKILKPIYGKSGEEGTILHEVLDKFLIPLLKEAIDPLRYLFNKPNFLSEENKDWLQVELIDFIKNSLEEMQRCYSFKNNRCKFFYHENTITFEAPLDVSEKELNKQKRAFAKRLKSRNAASEATEAALRRAEELEKELSSRGYVRLGR